MTGSKGNIKVGAPRYEGEKNGVDMEKAEEELSLRKWMEEVDPRQWDTFEFDPEKDYEYIATEKEFRKVFRRFDQDESVDEEFIYANNSESES